MRGLLLACVFMMSDEFTKQDFNYRTSGVFRRAEAAPLRGASSLEV